MGTERYVLFSPVGMTDPISDCRDGSMLHIARRFRPEHVYLYLSHETAAFDEADGRYAGALALLAEKLGFHVEVTKISRPDLVADFTDAPDFSKPAYRVVKHGQDVAVLALGDFFELGERVVAALAEHGIQATLVNPRFASEFDEELISSLPDRHRVVVTLEDGVLALSLSLNTVKVHIHNILRKTGCRDRQELRQGYWTDA